MDMNRNPLQFIDSLFDQYIVANPEGTVNSFIEDVAHFENILASRSCSDIPLFKKKSVGSIANNSLVLYRGLVYDIYDPEYYTASFVDKKSGLVKLSKYRDSIAQNDWEQEYDEDNESGIIMERLSLLCTAAPGESAWLNKIISEENEATVHFHEIPIENKKRPLDESEPVGLTRRSPPSKNSSLSSNPKMSSSLYSSLADPAIIKLYNNFEDLRLNDLVEFLCIYTADPHLTADVTADLLNEDDEPSIRLPPPSVAPRLQCIKFKKLGAFSPIYKIVNTPHFSSTDSEILNGFGIGNEYALTSRLSSIGYCSLSTFSECNSDSRMLSALTDHERILDVRQQVVMHLADIFNGDKLCGEYLLLALLSRLLARESVMVGMLSIQIVGVTKDIAISLENALAQIIPRVVRIAVDSATLDSSACFQPRRDYDNNTMTPSPLRIAPGTVLLFDNSIPSSIPLSNVASQSVRIIRGVISEQQLSVNCGYSEVRIPTESTCIVLSKEYTAQFGDEFEILSVPCNYVHSSGSDTPELVVDLSEEHLEFIRLYLSTVKLINTQMNESMLTFVENDYIQSRQSSATQEGNPVLNSGDFHVWVSLVRLITASYGQSSVSQEHWKIMRDMENRRVSQLQNIRPYSNNGGHSASVGINHVPFSPSSVAEIRMERQH